MARPRQPVGLLLHKGKTHLTKTQIEQRRREEIAAPADRVAPPPYLTKKQRERFEYIAGGLLQIGIMSNLDCDALARYVQSEEKYRQYDMLVDVALKEAGESEKTASFLHVLIRFEGLRDKAFKQCCAAASDLGLTISSRCKLTIPKEGRPKDPHAVMFGD